MLRDARAFQRFEDSVIRGSKMSHPQALRLLEAMWLEGVALGILPPKDPLEGIEVDMRISRIVNSCSKRSSQK